MKVLILILGLITSFAYAQSKAGFYVVGGKIITVQDTSSQKYLKAVENAGIVPSVVQNFASNFLVTAEKAIGSYSLMKAQYPFIGGTAATHKFNMNDPRDLDVAFRLTYSGTITHSALGMQGDGSTGYANTFLNPSVSLTQNSLSFGLYVKTLNTNNNAFDFGNGVPGSSNGFLRIYNTSAFGVAVSIGNNLTVQVLNNPTNSLSIVASRISSSSFSTSFNSKISSFSSNSTALLQNTPLTILSQSTVGVADNSISNATIGHLFVGAGLTDTQAIQQSKIATSFNGFLNRN